MFFYSLNLVSWARCVSDGSQESRKKKAVDPARELVSEASIQLVFCFRGIVHLLSSISVIGRFNVKNTKLRDKSVKLKKQKSVLSFELSLP